MGRLDPNLVVPGETPNRDETAGRKPRDTRQVASICILLHPSPTTRHVLLHCSTFWGRLKGRQGMRDKDKEQCCFSKGKCKRRGSWCKTCASLFEPDSVVLGRGGRGMTPHPAFCIPKHLPVTLPQHTHLPGLGWPWGIRERESLLIRGKALQTAEWWVDGSALRLCVMTPPWWGGHL